jgi:hypothetical protein
VNDKEREERYAANAKFLRGNSGFIDMPTCIKGWILKSPNATADFNDFFAKGGRIVAEGAEEKASYRAEPRPEIHVNRNRYEFARLPEGWYSATGLFSILAHEIGHDKDGQAKFPPNGTIERYVQFRSEKEARAIFNSFPIFADLAKNDPEFRPKLDEVGYDPSGLRWGLLYQQWSIGNLDDESAVKEMAKTVADFTYTRSDGLTDQNQDGRLTQRDLYLRDYQALLRHPKEPDAPPQTLNLHDMREPDHPGHRGYREILHRVGMFEAKNHMESGPHSEQLAASIAALAAREKLDPNQIFVEKNDKGLIEMVARPRYGEPDSSERRIGIDAAQLSSQSIEQSSMQLALAFSSHYGSDAPAAGRTREQAEASEQLSANDRAIFDKIRAGAPPHVSDDSVANAMLLAKRDGIDTVDKLASVTMSGDHLCVMGTTPGFHAAVDVTAQVPAMQETVRKTQTFDQEREQRLAMEAIQRGPDDPSRGRPAR